MRRKRSIYNFLFNWVGYLYFQTCRSQLTILYMFNLIKCAEQNNSKFALNSRNSFCMKEIECVENHTCYQILNFYFEFLFLSNRCIFSRCILIKRYKVYEFILKSILNQQHKIETTTQEFLITTGLVSKPFSQKMTKTDKLIFIGCRPNIPFSKLPFAGSIYIKKDQFKRLIHTQKE